MSCLQFEFFLSDVMAVASQCIGTQHLYFSLALHWAGLKKLSSLLVMPDYWMSPPERKIAPEPSSVLLCCEHLLLRLSDLSPNTPSNLTHNIHVLVSSLIYIKGGRGLGFFCHLDTWETAWCSLAACGSFATCGGIVSVPSGWQSN